MKFLMGQEPHVLDKVGCWQTQPREQEANWGQQCHQVAWGRSKLCPRTHLHISFSSKKKREQEYFPWMPVMIWNVNLLECCKVYMNVHLNNQAFEVPPKWVCCRTRELCSCVFRSSIETEGDCAPGLWKSGKVCESGWKCRMVSSVNTGQ